MSTAPKGIKPHYRMKVRDPVSGYFSEIGAAWLSEDGHITVKLGPCATLSSLEQSTRSLQITLFPTEELAKR